jgi:hypothetical protein
MNNTQNNTFQSTDLTFVASCLLVNNDIQLIAVTQDHKGIRVFHLSPIGKVKGLQVNYSRGEILLSPLALANQIRQLKTWPVTNYDY